MTYQEQLNTLADRSKAAAIALWTRLDDPDDDLDEEVFVPALAASVAAYNGRAQSLARLAFAAQSMMHTGKATAVADLPILEDTDRLHQAAATVLDVAREANDPEAIVGRLGRSEALSTANQTFTAAMKDSPIVERWVRGLSPEACELCQWWYRDGKSW
jgi:hypothetical protein